ncbi:MAG TPA: Mur ligase domain-containing protein, partial [Stellaceae bacterium]|nr:Mur ligase domain-containing protein [Stellaceae bacterium]
MQRGFLFAALPGTKVDGKRFIADALARGAAAVLLGDASSVDAAVPLLIDPNPRRQFAKMAAAFHAPQPKTIAAVTGTNGKTSVT